MIPSQSVVHPMVFIFFVILLFWIGTRADLRGCIQLVALHFFFSLMLFLYHRTFWGATPIEVVTKGLSFGRSTETVAIYGSFCGSLFSLVAKLVMRIGFGRDKAP